MQDSDKSTLRLEYFKTLRQEIKATKARIFIILMAGLIGVPLLVFLTPMGNIYVHILAPVVVLVLLVLYLAEQTELMRAGRYIRENVEDADGDWEHWVVANGYRAAEKQLFAMFVVVCLMFFLITINLLIDHLMLQPNTSEETLLNYRIFQARFWRIGLPLMFSVGLLWVVLTLSRFWRSAVLTK